MQRRDFLKTSAVGSTAWAMSEQAAELSAEQNDQTDKSKPRQFRLWVAGCSHVGTDLKRKRESLAEAIRQSEFGGKAGGPAFDWDAAIHLGDLSGSQGGPDDEEGQEVVRQFGAAKKHRREHFYNVAGNHDASLPDQPSMGWFKKWVDPMASRPSFQELNPANAPTPLPEPGSGIPSVSAT